MNRIARGIRLLLAISAFVLMLMAAPGNRMNAQAAAVKGIDVSSWQGNIDWQAVKNSGVNFVMVRLGNSHYGIDEKVALNAVGAANAGLRVGGYVYSYAKNPSEAARDAMLAVSILEKLPISFPVAIDLEDKSQATLSARELQDIANTFCSVVYSAGYTPMVYSYRNWFIEKMPAQPWDVWIAQYNDHVDYPYHYEMWQASNKGRVPGIAGDVDIDYVFKDYFTQIIPEGLVNIAGNTFYYHNWRKQFGFQNVGGIMYFFDGIGAMVKDQTLTDAAGNITRICKDGRVVMITAEMQAAAAQAQALSAQADAALAAAKADLAQKTAAMQAAGEQYTALKAQADALSAAAVEALGAAQVLPTDELVQAAAIAQQLYADGQKAADAAQLLWAAAQTAVTDAQTIAAVREAEALQAKQTAQAALLTVQIPD
ncbi:MAG: glycoside hydrolase family 25 protein [Lachnospiraceae bacterium]|nr:glycoside hydrolase family 25 protein [Lachnospiraceae bacterium]